MGIAGSKVTGLLDHAYTGWPPQPERGAREDHWIHDEEANAVFSVLMLASKRPGLLRVFNRLIVESL